MRRIMPEIGGLRFTAAGMAADLVALHVIVHQKLIKEYYYYRNKLEL